MASPPTFNLPCNIFINVIMVFLLDPLRYIALSHR